jgi:sugar phosphate permease
MNSNQTSKLLKLTRNLFFLNAAVWLAFGISSLLFRAIDEGSLTRWVITIMMIANAIVMIWFGVMIVTGRNWVFILAILYMALNVVLSIADQFGWVDALILLLNLIMLGLLFVTRSRMSQTNKVPSGEI